MPEFLKQKILENLFKINNYNDFVSKLNDINSKINFNFESFIKFYKNGNELPYGINGLYEGCFNIIIILYNFACAEIDLGNNLKFFHKLNFDANVKTLKDFIK